ncbi:MAG: hypothetical protein ACRCZA_08065 [Shewanella sp.]|uniref:hypothetical protein n=1 Tax=Shewanella sp. TaxID=50422 RepID=UPI003F2DF80F
MIKGDKGLVKGGECASIFCTKRGANSFSRYTRVPVYLCQACAMEDNEKAVIAVKEPAFVVRQDSKL